MSTHRTQPTPRYDIYVRIHKALRLFMFDTLQALGSAGSDDQEARQQALDKTQELLGFLAGHLQHENDFVHTAMEARRPGSSHEVADDHVHHQQEIARLQRLASRAVSDVELTALYRELSLFAGHNLAHMHVEETQHNAVLWDTHTDEELMGIEQAIVASLPPEESMLCMRWMIPAMSHAQRVETLSGTRDCAPPPVHAALLGLARQTLDSTPASRKAAWSAKIRAGAGVMSGTKKCLALPAMIQGRGHRRHAACTRGEHEPALRFNSKPLKQKENLCDSRFSF